jgi:transposase
MRKERKHYTAEEKVAILRRHLLDKVPVSDLCEELGLQWRWRWRYRSDSLMHSDAFWTRMDSSHLNSGANRSRLGAC